VPRGDDYQDAIVDALDQSGAMVLVFSKNANNSEEIKRELALASTKRLFVLPVRIENAEPTKGFKYQLATRQYVDLFEDREQNMTLIINTLQKHLQSSRNPN
jgi:TIR domain